jgi:hypothetical protein
MSVKLSKLLAAAVSSAALLAGATMAHASAGFIALEGSDATTYHEDPVYTPQLFHYLQGSSTKDVLVLGDGYSNPYPTGGVATTSVSSLSGVDLSLYSAIYVKSPGGCCTADPTALDGYGSAVNAFIAAGGNLSIENYMGGSYDGVVPGGAGASVAAGTVAGVGCADGEVTTPIGIAKGFGQPPVDYCWSHQGYELSYFTSLGYLNLISADPSYGPYEDGTNLGSSLLAYGGTLGSSGAPEPTTWALMMMGVFGVGSLLRSRRRASVATA